MEKEIAQFIRQLEDEKDFILQNSTEGVVTRMGAKSATVMSRSPVATGEFVRDWDAAINHWPSDTKPENDPGKRNTAKRLREVIRRARWGDAIFFENTDPASVFLEFGGSKQAPNGIVRLVARSWNKQVRNSGVAATRKIRKRLAGD